jgi:hypothetical protein
MAGAFLPPAIMSEDMKKLLLICSVLTLVPLAGCAYHRYPYRDYYGDGYYGRYDRDGYYGRYDNRYGYRDSYRRDYRDRYYDRDDYRYDRDDYR